jgi:uncharacterized protein (DUF1330 family)
LRPRFPFRPYPFTTGLRRGGRRATFFAEHTNEQARETIMARAYWVATYFGISDPNKMAEYAKLAPSALQAYGAKFLARGTAAQAYEKGIKDRVVLIEFESVEKAVAAHDSPGYQAALKALDGAAQRDIRIVEAL